jgi:uncharacterized protein
VRVLSPRPDGTLAIISYFSKHAKGRLARALIERVADGGTVAAADDVAEVWTATEGGAATVSMVGHRVQLDLVAAS